jgi:hypothetical protein
VLFDRFEALANIGIDSRVHEGYPPIVDIAIEQIDLLATTRKNKIVGSALVVIEKVIFDDFGSISQAQNEVFMPKVSVIFHNMPENRPVTDLHHRLGNIFRVTNA